MPLTLPEGRIIPDAERTRCEVWSRVMGYYRPVDQWNAGKQSEHRGRLAFAEPEELRLDYEGKCRNEDRPHSLFR